MKANHNSIHKQRRLFSLFQRAKLQKMKANHNSALPTIKCGFTVSKSKITKNES